MKQKAFPSEKPIVLTIAGFDPSSGAGITADIRTLENIGVYGMSVCTAITIQNASNVTEWISLNPQTIEKQLNVLFDSYNFNVVKTGMLGTINAVELVKKFHDKKEFRLVVDPVTISGTGKRLADKNTAEAIKNILFPIADAVTFNIHEAEEYSGKKITDFKSIKEISSELITSGLKNVIIKGGHLDENSDRIVDFLYNSEFFRYYPRKRIKIESFQQVHGTGCVFSSLISGFLAMGYSMEESIFFSEDFMDFTFSKLFPLKNGIVLDMGYSAEEIDVLKAVQKVVNYICSKPEFSRYIPEVRMNVAISKQKIRNLEDIAAVEGRITILSGKPVAAGPIKFGVSNHTGRLLFQAKSYDDSINVVTNLRYAETTIKSLKKTNLDIFNVNRLKAEDRIRTTEKSSMGWIIREVYKHIKKIPDVIWDSGEPEKEPMIRLFAKNADDMIKKLSIFLKI